MEGALGSESQILGSIFGITCSSMEFINLVVNVSFLVSDLRYWKYRITARNHCARIRCYTYRIPLYDEDSVKCWRIQFKLNRMETYSFSHSRDLNSWPWIIFLMVIRTKYHGGIYGALLALGSESLRGQCWFAVFWFRKHTIISNILFSSSGFIFHMKIVKWLSDPGSMSLRNIIVRLESAIAQPWISIDDFHCLIFCSSFSKWASDPRMLNPHHFFHSYGVLS